MTMHVVRSVFSRVRGTSAVNVRRANPTSFGGSSEKAWLLMHTCTWPLHRPNLKETQP